MDSEVPKSKKPFFLRWWQRCDITDFGDIVMLETEFRCRWHHLNIGARRLCEKIKGVEYCWWPNGPKLSPTSNRCHQNHYVSSQTLCFISPTSVTNIDNFRLTFLVNHLSLFRGFQFLLYWHKLFPDIFVPVIWHLMIFWYSQNEI